MRCFKSQAFLASLFLALAVDRVWAQSALDRRESNQPILLVESESPSSYVFALKFVSDGASGLRLLAAGDDKLVWQWQIRPEPQSGSILLDPLPRIRWPINRGTRGQIATLASRHVGAAGPAMVAFGGFGLPPTSVQLHQLGAEHSLVGLHDDRMPFSQRSVLSLEFWPNPSQLLAVGCLAVEPKQALILIWDLQNADRPRAVLETGFDAVRFMSVSPDGSRLLATDGLSLRIRRWNIRDLNSLKTDPMADLTVPSPVVGFEWLDQDRCLAATQKHGLVILEAEPLNWEPTTARLVIRNRTGRKLTMAARRQERNLATWDVAVDRSETVTSPVVQQIAVQDAKGNWQNCDVELQSSPAWDLDVDVDPSGRMRVQAFVGMNRFASANGVSASVKRSFRLDRWPPDRFGKSIDLENLLPGRPNLARLKESEFSGEVTVLAVSPDGSYIAAAGEQLRSTGGQVGEQPIQEIRVWRVADGALVAVTPDRRRVLNSLSPIRSVGLSRSQTKTTVPDVVQFSWSNDKRVSLSLQEVESSQAISSNRAIAVKTQSQARAQTWNVRFDRDQYWLALQADKPLEVGPFPQLDWMSSDVLASHQFRHQGKEFMAIGYREVALIWDLARLRQLANSSNRQKEQAIVRSFYRHTGRFSCVSTSEEGDCLISGADDGSICMWSLDGIEQSRDGLRELGLKLKRDARSLRVDQVTDGWPAYFAGLRVGDELVRIRLPRSGQMELDWIVQPDQIESALMELTPGLGVVCEVRGRHGHFAAELIREPLWILFPMLDGEWVITSPAQFFGASSDEAMRRFGWHLNLGGDRDHQVALFSLDLFRGAYERLPSIVQTAWKNRTPVVRPSSFAIPTLVEITEVRAATGRQALLTSELSQPTDLEVTLRLHRSGSETPKQLEMWCNGRLVQQSDLEPDGSIPPNVRWIVPKSALRIGERNLLIAIVRSDLPRTDVNSSEPPIKLVNRAIRTISVNGTSRPKLHFLGIGVTELDHAAKLQQSLSGLKPLRFAANDVCLLGHALVERATDSGFVLGEVRYLVPTVPEGLEIAADQIAPPTHGEILKALDRLCEIVEPNDFVCVAISCHGFAAENGAYLVVQDTAPGFRKAVTDRELFENRLWKMNGSALVLLDACHSGSALTSDALRGLNGIGLGPEVLVSCKPRQESFESERLHRWGNRWFGMSVFSASLLEAITGHELSRNGTAEPQMTSVNYSSNIDRNGDGFLSIDELGLHATLRVPTLQRMINRNVAETEISQQPDLLPSLAFPRSRIRLRIPAKR